MATALLTIHGQAKGCCLVSAKKKCLKRVRPKLIYYIPRSSPGWLLSSQEIYVFSGDSSPNTWIRFYACGLTAELHVLWDTGAGLRHGHGRVLAHPELAAGLPKDVPALWWHHAVCPQKSSEQNILNCACVDSKLSFPIVFRRIWFWPQGPE